MARVQDVAAARRLHAHIECRLDEELKQTFPASDAPQITRDRPPYQDHQHRRAKPAAGKEKARRSAR